jgi:hypothetical protein
MLHSARVASVPTTTLPSTTQFASMLAARCVSAIQP